MSSQKPRAQSPSSHAAGSDRSRGPRQGRAHGRRPPSPQRLPEHAHAKPRLPPRVPPQPSSATAGATASPISGGTSQRVAAPRGVAASKGERRSPATAIARDEPQQAHATPNPNPNLSPNPSPNPSPSLRFSPNLSSSGRLSFQFCGNPAAATRLSPESRSSSSFSARCSPTFPKSQPQPLAQPQSSLTPAPAPAPASIPAQPQAGGQSCTLGGSPPKLTPTENSPPNSPPPRLLTMARHNCTQWPDAIVQIYENDASGWG